MQDEEGRREDEDDVGEEAGKDKEDSRSCQANVDHEDPSDGRCLTPVDVEQIEEQEVDLLQREVLLQVPGSNATPTTTTSSTASPAAAAQTDAAGFGRRRGEGRRCPLVAGRELSIRISRIYQRHQTLDFCGVHLSSCR